MHSKGNRAKWIVATLMALITALFWVIPSDVGGLVARKKEVLLGRYSVARVSLLLLAAPLELLALYIIWARGKIRRQRIYRVTALIVSVCLSLAAVDLVARTVVPLILVGLVANILFWKVEPRLPLLHRLTRLGRQRFDACAQERLVLIAVTVFIEPALALGVRHLGHLDTLVAAELAETVVAIAGVGVVALAGSGGVKLEIDPQPIHLHLRVISQRRPRQHGAGGDARPGRADTQSQRHALL